MIEEARKRRVLLPTPRMIDLLCQQARVRSERLLHRALTSGLTEATKSSLDALLEVMPDTAITRLSWLRNASQSPAPTNILGLIERLRFLRQLGLEGERRQAIPLGAFARMARDAMKITVQHLAETVAPRRHALLVAAALSLETALTDATVLMFDKLMGSLSRKAERRSQEKAARAARNLQEKLLDTSVWRPGGLDFAGAAVLGPGLTQKKFDPYIIHGGIIDSEAAIAAGSGRFKSVAAWQSNSVEVRRALHIAKPETRTRQRTYIKRRVEEDVEAGFERAMSERKWRMAVCENVLPGYFRLHFRDKGTVTVADVLKDPGAYDLERLADPNEPDYRDDGRIAIFYANQNGDCVPRICSHAHGRTKYVLRTR